MEEDALDFGELSQDENFKQKLLGFRRNVENASKMLDTFFTRYNYDELSPEDKVRYDLFLAFALNSYYWMYLRIRGIDPNEHDIKGQINRVREYMSKSKKIYERKTIMPKLDQGAAKRFIRSGLWMAERQKAPGTSSSDPVVDSYKIPTKFVKTDKDTED